MLSLVRPGCNLLAANRTCITSNNHAKIIQFYALAILLNNNFGSNILMANLRNTLRYIMRSNRMFFISVVILFLQACTTVYQPSSLQYKNYRIKQVATVNPTVKQMLSPYADSVNSRMNNVVAIAGMELEKKQPESTLGNVLADAMLYQAGRNYTIPVDAAFVNYGGVRLNTLAAGNITLGKVFEIAPFDNVIVILKIKADTLLQLLNIIAARGGWPCAGVQFKIDNKKAVAVHIAGQPIVADAYYHIALVDYIANGGDECEMLKAIPQINNGYLFRDAVIDYLMMKNRNGEKISASIQNRISHVQ
jgi:2',3'-cyclic-nucleotide 2'-phosphodiesterase (5'-nucleotidase family)